LARQPFAQNICQPCTRLHIYNRQQLEVKKIKNKKIIKFTTRNGFVLDQKLKLAAAAPLKFFSTYHRKSSFVYMRREFYSIQVENRNLFPSSLLCPSGKP
jgi:hypothetical protein